MNLSIWRDKVAIRLGDPGFTGKELAGGIYLNKRLLTYYINEARRLVSQKTLCYQKSGSITTVNGTNNYALPTDYGFIATRPGDRSYFTDTDGITYPLRLFSWTEYLRLKPSNSWTGTPEFIHFRKSDDKVYLYPCPDTSITDGLTVVARCFVPEFDDNDEVTDGIPEEYQEIVYNKILSELHPDAQVRKEQFALFKMGCREAIGELAKEAQPQHATEVDFDFGIP